MKSDKYSKFSLLEVPNMTVTRYNYNTLKEIKVSALMSVFHGDDHQHFFYALQSVTDQINIEIELILVADGCLSNDLEEILNEFIINAKISITFIRISVNNGLAVALNLGLSYCNAKLVARFDSDDISHPERLITQSLFLDENPWVDIVGTDLTLIDTLGSEFGTRIYPKQHDDIKNNFYLRNPMAHPSVMFKKDEIVKVGSYPNFRKAQDYALWGKCLVSGCIMENIPCCLVKMRVGRGLSYRRGLNYFMYEVQVLRYLREIRCITSQQYYVSYCLRFSSRVINELLIFRFSFLKR